MDVDDCSVYFIEEFIFRIYNIITRQDKTAEKWPNLHTTPIFCKNDLDLSFL